MVGGGCYDSLFKNKLKLSRLSRKFYVSTKKLSNENLDTEMEITWMLIYTVELEIVCDYVCILFLHIDFMKSCSSVLEATLFERRNINRS